MAKREKVEKRRIGKGSIIAAAIGLVAVVGVGAALIASPHISHRFQETFGLEVTHVYDEENTVTVDATCKKNGSITKTCEVCGEKEVKYLPMTDHVVDESTVVVVPPTTTTNGSKTYTCKTCGDEVVEILFITGHTGITVEGVPATCTEDGLTEGVKCEVCGDMVVAQEVIPALGHDIDGSECTRCDYISLDALYPAGYEYVTPTIGEDVDGQIYRLMSTENVADGAVCLSGLFYTGLSTVEVPAFDVYGDKIVSLESDVSVSDYIKYQFFDYDGYRFIKLTDISSANTSIVINKIYSSSTVRRVVAIEYDTEYTLWNLPESEHMTLTDGVLTFNGTGEVALTTKDTYENFEMTFTVDEVSDVRGAFQLGIGAPTTETSINVVSYVQFNYDRPVVVAADGTTLDDLWTNGSKWKIKVQDGLLTLSCENGVVCENVDIGAGAGHLILRAENSCALSIHNLRIVEL